VILSRRVKRRTDIKRGLVMVLVSSLAFAETPAWEQATPPAAAPPPAIEMPRPFRFPRWLPILGTIFTVGTLALGLGLKVDALSAEAQAHSSSGASDAFALFQRAEASSSTGNSAFIMAATGAVLTAIVACFTRWYDDDDL
jgi:hypothetical protein